MNADSDRNNFDDGLAKAVLLMAVGLGFGIGVIATMAYLPVPKATYYSKTATTNAGVGSEHLPTIGGTAVDEDGDAIRDLREYSTRRKVAQDTHFNRLVCGEDTCPAK